MKKFSDYITKPPKPTDVIKGRFKIMKSDDEKMLAMGIPADTLPVGWWIGFKVIDKDVWEKVKDGTYPMFSIEGEAERVEA